MLCHLSDYYIVIIIMVAGQVLTSFSAEGRNFLRRQKIANRSLERNGDKEKSTRTVIIIIVMD